MAKSENMRRINLELERKSSSRGASKNTEKAEDSVNSEIEKAQRMIEELRLKKEQQQREMEHKKQIQGRRDEFSDFRSEVLEKLSEALPRIDQELNGAKQEITDLEQAKKHFVANLKTIETINPDTWNDDELVSKSEKFQNLLSKAAKDYDQFSSILSGGRSKQSIKTMAAKTLVPVSGFWQDVIRGFAFSLPLIVAIFIVLLLVNN